MTKSFIEEVRQFKLNDDAKVVQGTAFDAWVLAPKAAKALIAIDDELTKMEEGGNWQVEAAAHRLRKILEGEQK